MLDNRTIRTALRKRVPEVYFVHRPIRHGGTIFWRIVCNINGRPYKMIQEMPDTALVSHRELLNTLVSEVYDEVKAIKCGAKTPPLFPGEEDWPPLTDEELRVMSHKTLADHLLDDKALHFVC